MQLLKASFLTLLALAAISCNKDSDDDSTPAVTEEEAVELVEASLSEESAGASATTAEYARAYEEEIEQNVQCNVGQQTSYNLTYNGNLAQANYHFEWDYLIACNSLSIPESATLNSSGNGTYSTNRLESDDASTFNASVTGLEPSVSAMTFNGNFERSGTQRLTTNQNTRSITSTFSTQLNDLVVSKADYQIDSGTGSFTLTGTNNEHQFSFAGTIEFTGNQTATVTINGSSYNISLN